MSKPIDLTPYFGKIYGRLAIIDDAGTIAGERRFKVKCECGNIKTIRYDKITKKGYSSCGCRGFTIKGIKAHSLYDVYQGIKQRCFNVKDECYDDYGGRGITMCDEWRFSVEAFYNWCFANRWQKGLQIDRRDNDGRYTPDNCRFVTSKVNNRNRRSNRNVTYNGETKTVSEWADVTGIGKGTILKRLNLNWDITRILTKKPNHVKRVLSV